ncbi:hypothetical protein SAMN04488524_2527 [Pedobacter africanus]|uniref:Uncharacterized protein n=1 Tax=Pedobacter africanus TaxID=151894 RepID=A0A1W2BP95_9SPHI|nr:hypothetical protein SAMN04488524_2527 [Pedobacter africanus]
MIYFIPVSISKHGKFMGLTPEQPQKMRYLFFSLNDQTRKQPQTYSKIHLTAQILSVNLTLSAYF